MLADDIVLINTGWHRKYSDSQEYFGHAPGLTPAAAQWLIDRKVKLVGVDTATVDHPLATSIGPHRNGPQIKYLLPEYKKATGREAIEDFPSGIPRIVFCLAREFRPLKTSAAIWIPSAASAAPSRASPGNGTRATPASFAWSPSSIPAAPIVSNPERAP